MEKGFETIAAAGFDCIDLNLDAMLGLQWNEMREGKPSEFFFNKEIYERYAEEIIAASKKPASPLVRHTRRSRFTCAAARRRTGTGLNMPRSVFAYAKCAAAKSSSSILPSREACA